MGPFLQNVIELFSKKKVQRTNIDSSERYKTYMIIVKDAIPSKGLMESGTYRPSKELELIDAHEAFGDFYNKTFINEITELKVDPFCPGKSPIHPPDDLCFLIDGSKQYYECNLTIDDTYTMNVIDPLPVGTYLIFINYKDLSDCTVLDPIGGVTWPSGIAPTWTASLGKTDILTIVSDGKVNRAVATLNYS